MLNQSQGGGASLCRSYLYVLYLCNPFLRCSETERGRCEPPNLLMSNMRGGGGV